jgi:ribosomal protein S18 acetylase RimI-like enzyme
VIVGLIDVELDDGGGGMIWHIAVHPDHQGRGIGTALLREAERGLSRIQAWTRDDAATQRWYESHGFTQVDGYLHVYVELDEGLRDLWPLGGGRAHACAFP